MRTVAQRFLKARKHIGLSQQEVAKITKSAQQTISEIELGRLMHEAQIKKIKKFAKTLFVSPEWLLFGKNPPEWAKQYPKKPDEMTEKFYVIKNLQNNLSSDFGELLESINDISLKIEELEQRVKYG